MRAGSMSVIELDNPAQAGKSGVGGHQQHALLETSGRADSRTISSGLKTSARGDDYLRGGMNSLFSSHPRVSL